MVICYGLGWWFEKMLCCWTDPDRVLRPVLSQRVNSTCLPFLGHSQGFCGLPYLVGHTPTRSTHTFMHLVGHTPTCSTHTFMHTHPLCFTTVCSASFVPVSSLSYGWLEHLLLLRRTQVWFPAPSWQLTAVCDFRSKGPSALFRPVGIRHAHSTQTYNKQSTMRKRLAW